MPTLSKTVLCAVTLMLTTAQANAEPAFGYAPEPAASTDTLRGDSPIQHTGGEDCGCSACATEEVDGWRGKMKSLVDFCCMKHRWFPKPQAVPLLLQTGAAVPHQTQRLQHGLLAASIRTNALLPPGVGRLPGGSPTARDSD